MSNQPNSQLKPKRIRRVEGEGLEITWEYKLDRNTTQIVATNTEHQEISQPIEEAILLSGKTLREACPCAACSKTASHEAPIMLRSAPTTNSNTESNEEALIKTSGQDLHKTEQKGKKKKPTSLSIIGQQRIPDKSELYLIKEIWPVGNYSIGIKWGDNHSFGIYSFQLLKSLCDS